MPESRLLEIAQSAAALGVPAALGDTDLVAAVRLIGELRRAVDALGVAFAAELDRRCDTDGETPDRVRGYRGSAELIEAEAGVDLAEARAWRSVGTVTAARTAITGEPLPPVRPVIADAIASGALSLAAADLIAHGLAKASQKGSPDQIDAFERTLVEVAPHITSRELRSVCRRVIDVVDPDGAEPREEDLRARSSVTVRKLDDGLTRIVAHLHPQAASMVLTALDARTAPRRQPAFALGDATEASDADAADGVDRRPLALKRVDALEGIARTALAADPGQVAGTPVGVIVTVALEALTTGLGTAHLSGVDEPISAATARRLASDAGIIPAVLGTDSEVLDLGRTARLASPAQRRALALRDGGCVWFGCEAPPGWCEVAHLLAWVLGGRTDLESLALMCPFHHRLYDRDGWELRRIDGAPWLIPPAHLDATRTPRRAGRLPMTA